MFRKRSRFGRLVVLEDRGCKNVLCRCDCGTEKIVTRANLSSGNTQSCGCLRSQKLREKWAQHSSKLYPDPGDVFGRLTVLCIKRQKMLCKCECGKKKWLFKYDVIKGATKSCGCYSREVSAENMRRTSTKHGGWGTREWNLWHNMRRRCYEPSAMGYENYGGRGIKVCARWLGNKGFPNFLKDMGTAPTSKHSLDRIDPDGDYRPKNVRWSTPKEQARNRRNNRMLTAFGRTQCLAAWAEEVGLSHSTISYRLLKGWTTEEAVTKRK